MIVRPGERFADPDFLAIFGLTSAEMDIDPLLTDPRSPDIIDSICRFYSNRTKTPVDVAERQLISPCSAG